MARSKTIALSNSVGLNSDRSGRRQATATGRTWADFSSSCVYTNEGGGEKLQEPPLFLQDIPGNRVGRSVHGNDDEADPGCEIAAEVQVGDVN